MPTFSKRKKLKLKKKKIPRSTLSMLKDKDGMCKLHFFFNGLCDLLSAESFLL